MTRAYCYEYPRPAVTVDMVVFTAVNHDLKVLLVRRGEPPFEGRWALPGGFVHVDDAGDQGEPVDAAAGRELFEETGLRPAEVFLEQLYTFGQTGRDPRGRVISVAYYALVSPDLVGRVRAGDDAAAAKWWSVAQLPPQGLAFDHGAILDVGVGRIRGKVDYDLRVAGALVPAEFTKAELRGVYEVVSGQAYDRSNFNKRFNRMLEDGLLGPAPGRRVAEGPGRPARLYRFARLPSSPGG